MLFALLTFLGAVSATLHIRAEYNGPQFQIYLFKPLTMIFILLIAIEKTNEMRWFYGNLSEKTRSTILKNIQKKGNEMK
jgi:uncharacterized membrane protein YhhN